MIYICCYTLWLAYTILNHTDASAVVISASATMALV